jgi:hypothetical protein
MLTGAAGRSNAASGRQGQFLAVLIAGVVGLAIGGVTGASLPQPQLNVAAQPQRGSATHRTPVDDLLEAQLIGEAHAWAAVATADRISAEAHRTEGVLEFRLLTEARALELQPMTPEHPRSMQRVVEEMLEARLITEARLLEGVAPGE